MAAAILRGHRVHPDVRLIIIPASQEIYAQAGKEGILSAFAESDAMVCLPSCGPCSGLEMGVLGAGEVSLATSNRNFPGRGGDPSSKIYLSNASVAAASAIAGKIVDPRKFMGGMQ
jgi:homoaconitase/3-isopropylmalate dehydratase large subunit